MFNILLITADQWRGDCLGYAGHGVVKTPNLDRLAGEGVAFLRHYAQAAPCSPARACLYTGLYQMNNRVCRNGSPLDSRFDNMALAARRAGYDPTLFGFTDQSPDPRDYAPGDPVLTTYEGVLPGFTARVKLPEHEKAWHSWLRTQGLDLPAGDAAHRPVGVPVGTIGDAPPAYSKDQTQTAFLTGEFVRWLGEQDTGQPWFAHLSFLRPHPPFVVPAPYNTMYSPDAVDGFARAKGPEAEMALHPLVGFGLANTKSLSFVPDAPGLVKDLSDAEFRQIKATYYGMIGEVDAQLGRVFEAVRAAGAWDETLIVFTSDHAEMMGDHWYLGKGGFFDESQHIPLIIRDPVRRSAFGSKVSAFTEAVDLFPTLLAYFGTRPTHHPDGASLIPFLAGEQPVGWRDAIHWEFDFRDVSGRAAERWFELPSTRLSMAALRTERYKYVHFTGLPPLLFDMVADRQNALNLADDPAHLSIRLELAEKLLVWRAEHLDQTLALSELTPAGVVSGAP
ncbi:MAG: alkaline phosphatase family protein [Devosia sp.]|nr:alkaline phosphatase family protein [Devosia sp.]